MRLAIGRLFIGCFWNVLCCVTFICFVKFPLVGLTILNVILNIILMDKFPFFLWLLIHKLYRGEEFRNIS